MRAIATLVLASLAALSSVVNQRRKLTHLGDWNQLLAA
jgi:hypothetical protein